MPILSVEGYFRPNRLVRDKEWRYRKWHYVLHAKNLTGWHNLIKITSEAYCVTPEMKVLTADLRWAEARTLKVGDELLGFRDGEQKTMEKSFVKNISIVKKLVYKIKLKDKTILRCSAEHPWLTIYGSKNYKATQVAWKTTQEIYERYNEVREKGSLEELIKQSKRRGARVNRDYRLVRYFYPWEYSDDYNSGYLAAAFDGEGHIFPNSAGKNGDKGGGIKLGFSQNSNSMLEKVKEILMDKEIGFYFVDPHNRKCKRVEIKGRHNQFELLGKFRPPRLLNNFDKILHDESRPVGVMQKVGAEDIDEIIFEGLQDVSALETSTGTFICEGFGAHNSSGFYQTPCFDWELLEKYHEGLITSSACILGPLSFLIENGSEKEVDDFVIRTKKIFGDDFYVSIMPHNFDRQRAVNLELISLANKHGIPIVYEGDSHYPYKGWVDTQKIAILIGTNSTVEKAEEQNKKRLENNEEIYELWHDGLHLMDEKEVCEAFAKYHPGIPSSTVIESINNTDEIGSRIEPFIMDRFTKMPRAGKLPGEAEKKVIQWCREGLRKYGRDGDPVYEQRLEYELGVIRARGAFEYIFLAADWIRFCKSTTPLPGQTAEKRPMLITCRGSAAASIVCYLCNITAVDPITHRLKFERFINPERHGLPDIDFDFPSRRRNEAKEYLAIKYGRNSIADVVSHQHFQPRAALKNVTKVLYGFDSDAYSEISRICHEDSGLIDPVHDIDLEKMKLQISDLEKFSKSYPYAWEQSVRLENAGEPFVMRLSKHAAGIVLTPGDITDYMPTLRSDDKEVGYRTAWSETPRISIVDDYGFVKIDALGIAGKDQHEMIIGLVKDRTGEEVDLDNLPCMSDPNAVDDAVMDLAKNEINLGVCQFSGNGISHYLKKLSPNNIFDLTAANALYRPGPMGEKGHLYFAERKNGREEYSIPEILQKDLEDTYGILAYQESVMSVFQILLGYSAGQADDIRKTIDKKNRAKDQTGRAELEAMKAGFIEKASAKIGQENAERIWSEIIPYTGYGFNRSHSDSYSIQAYHDWYLKKCYPLESYAVIMSLEPKDSLRAIKEARYFDIKILPPDVNISNSDYTPDFENRALRYGLNGIKGVANTSSAQVMKLRPYLSLDDFEKKQTFKYSKCNKGHREKLLRVGALDSLGGRDAWPDTEKAEAEMELLGMALSAGGALGENEALVISKTHSEEEYNALEKGSNVVIGGIISEVKKTETKKGKNPGQKMGFIKISLGLDSFQCTLFPPAWSANKELIQIGNKVMVSGRKDDRGIIVSAMMLVDDWAAEMRGESVAA